MKFEYNGNLTFFERIDLVSKEILDVYPNINNVKLIASLEPPITVDLNIDMIFRRLYNIALINKNNYELINKIIIDMVNTLRKTNDIDGKYKNLIVSLIDYKNAVKDFPVYE